MRISDWSSDVCSSDLVGVLVRLEVGHAHDHRFRCERRGDRCDTFAETLDEVIDRAAIRRNHWIDDAAQFGRLLVERSEEHTSELQSLMRISYAVFCLKKKTYTTNKQS